MKMMRLECPHIQIIPQSIMLLVQLENFSFGREFIPNELTSLDIEWGQLISLRELRLAEISKIEELPRSLQQLLESEQLTQAMLTNVGPYKSLKYYGGHKDQLIYKPGVKISKKTKKDPAFHEPF